MYPYDCLRHLRNSLCFNHQLHLIREINRLVSLMHDRAISTFLVTNAQFPEAIRKLVPVTQLYISIDASTKESLKAVDQPLHSDFWERFLDSIDAYEYLGILRFCLYI